jgi:phosphoglycerate dehydrogenase-like enzyme
MTDPLIWIPFQIADLPPGLRYEVVADPGRQTPASVNEVVGYVLPYRFEAADSAFLDQASRLRWVQSLTAGVEHLVGRIPKGVMLCSGRGIHSSSTAELAISLILASLRGIPEFVQAQARQEWIPQERPALADRQVMIIGYGDIGQAVASRLSPFEVEIVKIARTARKDTHSMIDLPTLLPKADVVVLTVPLTAQTRHLVDSSFLDLIKTSGLLVNVARGAVIDTAALVAALNSGRISAALDVTDPEPLPPGHPLWTAPHLLLSPHVGGPTTAFLPRAQRLVRTQLERFVRNEPLKNMIEAD